MSLTKAHLAQFFGLSLVGLSLSLPVTAATEVTDAVSTTSPVTQSAISVMPQTQPDGVTTPATTLPSEQSDIAPAAVDEADVEASDAEAHEGHSHTAPTESTPEPAEPITDVTP
ncbi:MAG: hypothetical protein VXW65_13665 [Pseudomonadota bacterium]|nr:hypothetical protein [Pseudomonadota bacterium]